MTLRIPRLIYFSAFAVILKIMLASTTLSAAETTVAQLATSTHFHGISVDQADPSRPYLATHHGFYAVTLDGNAKRISSNQNDYMGFTPHPTKPSVLFASGHPVGGGNMGIITSTDRGKSWKKISAGANGPVDFHQMDASGADPNVIFGVSGGLQMSRDGGRTWTVVGTAPEGTIDLSASAKSVTTVYAATRRGIYGSVDNGRSWAPAYTLLKTATMVQVASDKMLYAFLPGIGLIRTSEPPISWRVVAKEFGRSVVVHLAVDPTDSSKIYVITYDSQSRAHAALATRNGGKTWSKLGSK